MDFQVKYIKWNECSSFEAKPKIIGYLSTDGNGKCSSDLSKIKYYIPPNKADLDHGLDLNAGYDKVIRKNVTPPNNIEDLLHWIESHSEQVASCRPDFISMRGVYLALLFTISSLGNKKDSGWIICAEKFKGKIYLCTYRTEEKKKFESTKSEELTRMESWGYKFEQYMLRDNPAEPPDTTKPVNENEEFCCFFSNKFGKHMLLYAGEIDGVFSNYVITEESILREKIKFAELKTRKELSKKSNNYYFKLKLVRTWCQSSLSLVEEVLFGFVEENGIVKRLERYSMDDLEKETKKQLNPRAARNFCNEFLDHVKQVVIEDRDKFIYKFSWDPRTQTCITGEKLSNANNQSEYSFLPEWYTLN